MLITYAFSNFNSFRNRVEINLAVGEKTAKTDWAAETEAGRISKVMAVIGANGAGKTNLLLPLLFMRWFMAQSFHAAPDSLIPCQPHYLAEDEPTQLECTFRFEGTLWRYELTCTPHQVLREALYRQDARFRNVFERLWDERARRYNIRQRAFGFTSTEAAKTRKNTSLIAAAAQYGVPLAGDLIKACACATNITLHELPSVSPAHALDNAAQYFFDNPRQATTMRRLLADWDFGLQGVDLVMRDAYAEGMRERVMPYGLHESHGRRFRLPMNRESSGTQSAFVLLAHCLSQLENGGLVILDALDSTLHPHLLEPLLGLFASAKTNPHHAQLLFTCHSADVLHILNKEHVMLVEKDEDGESDSYRLGRMMAGVRLRDNLYAKYMAGAYGAIPRL
ncbi:MAG: AAA family ATPase [Burkholderiaceae bacterium]|jgi:predicted ATPase|nr:AAA family ATPase [Burkholderiaceae bacterium]